MASLKRIWTLSLACGGLLLASHAIAQIAPGTGAKGPIDFSGESAERQDDKHLTIWHSSPASGPVEVDQNGARLVCDTLYIYSYGPGEGPNAQAKATPAKAAPAAGGDDGASAEDIKQLVAEGHVFYVTQNETVKGDRMVYDAEPDTITITGNVVAVQGKNVARGDKMVIDRKTNHSTMVSDATGRNKPNRVRAVIYSQGDNNTPAAGAQAPAKPAPAKPAPAPAKKP
jgi:lipopolysaccharide export system protein LptA